MRQQDFRTNRFYCFNCESDCFDCKDNQLVRHKEDEDGCYTIGGAIQVNETTEDAAVPGSQEELGVTSKAGPLAFVVGITLN